jgi:hypothetical protein
VTSFHIGLEGQAASELSYGPGTILRMQPGSGSMLCEQGILIFLNIFEVLYVHVYKMHRGQCINKGEGNVMSFIRNPW